MFVPGKILYHNAALSFFAAEVSSYFMPDEPEKDEYVLYGWYEAADFSGSAWDFEFDTVTYDVTLYARWMRQVR